jgi:uncharacterized DUF497 family protein
MQDEKFEWRDAKAAENLRDHGITLEVAWGIWTVG